jgi:hypothetical protein
MIVLILELGKAFLNIIIKFTRLYLDKVKV